MRMPGFSGERSLAATSRRYRRVVTAGYGGGFHDVSAQLKGGGFHRSGFGGLFTIGDYWTCKAGCETAKYACLETCEGTVDSPKASRNCTLCDDAYAACMQGCSRDIA